MTRRDDAGGGATTTRNFWRLPVYVLFVATTLLVIANGTRQNFGLFLLPLSADLGWGRSEFSLAIAVQNLVMGAAAPFVAALGDRTGPIRVIALSAACYAVGVLLISLSTTPETMILSAGFLVGLGLSGVGFTLPLGLVGRVSSDRNRSLWLGIVTAGGSAGQFAFAPISAGLISGVGWSNGIVVLSLIIAICVPLSLSMRAGSAATLSKPDNQSLRAALQEASRHRGYWLLVIGFYVCGFHIQFVGTHLPGFIEDSGASPWLAAWAIGAIGLFNIFGTIASGWMGSRWRKKSLLGLLYLARGVLFLVFIMLPVNEVTVLGFASIFGLLWLSTVPLTMGLIAQMFGPRYMTTLFAIVLFSHQLGSFSGIYLGGLSYDIYGTYEVAWWLCILLGGVAALIHWSIDDTPVARWMSEQDALRGAET